MFFSFSTIEDADGIIDQLQLAAAEGDVAGLKRHLHKLKGSGAAMHIDGLMVVVDYYQDLSEENRCKAIMEDLDALKRAIIFIADEIGRYIRELDR